MKAKAKKVKTFVEPSLNESELRYRRLFEAAQDGILILDAKTGAITDVNPFLIDMLGYSRDEFMGKKLWEVGAFKDIQASKDAFETLQNEKYVRYEDLPLKAKDGHLIEVEFVSNVYAVNRHKVIQCNIRDIIERKQVDEEKGKLLSILEASLNEIYVFDTNTLKFSYVNGAALQNTGYSSEEAKELTPLNLKPEFTEDTFREMVAPLLSAEKKILVFQTVHCRKDASLYPVEVHLQIVQTGIEKVFLAIIYDITERRQAEEALHESEDKFKYVFDYSVIGQSITLPSGEVQVNGAFCEMIDYSPEELKNKRWQDVTHPNDIESSRKELDSLLSGEREKVRVIKRYLKKDGSTIWADVSVALRRDGQGKPLYFMTSILDITKRKQAEEQLLQSEEKFRNLFNNSEVGMFRTQLDGLEILEFNEKYLKILGYTFDEVKSKASVDMWADKQERDRMVQLLKAEGRVTDFECGILNKQGEVRRCVTSLRLYRDSRNS